MSQTTPFQRQKRRFLAGVRLQDLTATEKHILSELGSYMRRLFFGAMIAGLTVPRVTCTCMGAGLAVRRMLCTCAHLLGRAKNPLHVQTFDNFGLLIYWLQKYGITNPTLEMIKIYPKPRFFNSKNCVFWMGFGIRNSSGGGLHSNINLDVDRLV